MSEAHDALVEAFVAEEQDWVEAHPEHPYVHRKEVMEPFLSFLTVLDAIDVRVAALEP